VYIIVDYAHESKPLLCRFQGSQETRILNFHLFITKYTWNINR